MPEVTDLMRVAQWAKSSGSPSDVYNAACRLLDTDNSAKVAADHLLDRAIDLARQVGRAEARAAQLQDERDALQAQVARLRTANIEREAVVKAIQRHGGGRNPQTQGAVEGQEARDAQEAAQ
jgi:uncharacterized protein YlxW (UPF0749 family)